jgi:drug/metabolite transporter (DMT)-like permease
MLLNGLATAAAFSLMFAALRRLGPSPTAVVMTLEAVSAIVLAAVFLDETLTALQLIGGVAILAATLLVGLTHEAPAEVP